MLFQKPSVENAIVSLVSLIIITSLGFLLCYKYLQYKNKHLLYLGLAFIMVWSPWWPASISFILLLMNLNGLNFGFYLLIGQMLLPISMLFWLIVMFDLFHLDKKKKQILFIIIISYIIIIEILIFYWFLNPDQAGYLRNELVPVYNLAFYIIIFFPVYIAFFLTALIFAFDILRSNQSDLKLKGKFVLLAVILLAVGIFLQVSVAGDDLLLISTIIVTFGMSMLYIGFTLPEWIKKLFLKQAS